MALYKKKGRKEYFENKLDKCVHVVQTIHVKGFVLQKGTLMEVES